MKKLILLIIFLPLFTIGQNTYQIAVLKYNGGGDWYANPTALPNLIAFSNENIGMPKALNKSSALAKFDYIVISHDDFYFCPEWDLVFKNEIDQLNHNFFYLSGIMVNYKKKVDLDNNSIPPVFDAGDSPKNFNENKLLNNLEKIKTFDFQGSTKCPGLVHKEIWERVGGWSEEFSPTGGDDSDFAMKLWKLNMV